VGKFGFFVFFTGLSLLIYNDLEERTVWGRKKFSRFGLTDFAVFGGGALANIQGAGYTGGKG
jgi:hypothetical protein